MPRPVAQGKASRVADARATNLVDRLAPAALLPYLRLARVDRPTGFWLLAIPCFWSVALASRSIGADYPDAWLLVLFAIGAVVMRAAGCTYNDIVDKDIDAKVARTHSRPLPSGEVSERSATIFMLVLCMIGLAVLLSFNAATVWLGLCVVPLVALYPLVKRYSYWPQAVLGLAFNWASCSAIPPCSAASNCRRSSSTPEPSPGLLATTPSTPIRTATTTSCSGSNRQRSDSGGRPRPGSQGSMRLLGSESP